MRSLIRTFDDPILQEKCDPVEGVADLEDLSLLERVLRATSDGVGIAAPQIGIKKQIVAIRPDIKLGKISFLINPEIIDSIGEEVQIREGCLSYPGVTCLTKRNNAILVRYKDKDMAEHVEKFRKFEAFVVAHEIDHISDPPVCLVGDYWREQIKQTGNNE